jgi:hypothetical protein
LDWDIGIFGIYGIMDKIMDPNFLSLPYISIYPSAGHKKASPEESGKAISL